MRKDMRDRIAQIEEAGEFHTVTAHRDSAALYESRTSPSEECGAWRRVVSVTFLGFLRRVAGQRECRVAVDADATVDDLLQALARAYGQDFSQTVFRAPGEVHTHLRVFLNEEEARMTDRVAPGGAPAEVALLVVPGFEGGR